MEPLGIHASRLARGLKVNRSTVSRLLARNARITPDLAARLGAYFGVPARWWLDMQVQFDAARLEQDQTTAAAVSPLELPDDVLLTPTGVLRLPSSAAAGAVERSGPVSLRVEQVLPPPPRQPGVRAVREVRYDNGSVALVGDES